MARQVFFDPFGEFTRGVSAGTADQSKLESDTRAARNSDFDFNTLQPYRTAAIQRQDALGKTMLPIQQAVAPFALTTAQGTQFDSDLNRSLGLARMLGITAPTQDLLSQYFNYVTRPGQTPGAPTQFFQPSRTDPNAPPVAIGQVQDPNERILGAADRDFAFKMRAYTDAQNRYAEQLRRQAQHEDAYRLYAQAQLERARNAGAAGPPSAFSLLGMHAPAAPAPSGQQPFTFPQPAQPFPEFTPAPVDMSQYGLQ